ncbi:hypothetical protein MYSTI_06008 [Myxococcus stipitatus DSM 14675]|uniref:Uncharacterized protein n=1 Tax=Myxococcus stipitatus (strain DSM 14675 / JCM 12634 / Mx s8) TaxID=1278073 RepID=L7UED5_MYXSD|nr:hypothetical protein [Myxococcus stipitatus]AGC47281.1 hypothetical protein MYSTI_06008 [Myxococcus stipitatus DSM 14675]
MTRQKQRLPKDFFRFETQPEEGAKVAEVVDSVIPGGRGFIQQLFRAKRDVLQGVSHLLQAQIRELEHIDMAIQGEPRPGPGRASSSSGAEGPLSPRMMTIKQMMQEATSRLRASAGGSTTEPPASETPHIPGHPMPAATASPPRSTEGGPGGVSGPSAPEKINLT